MQRVLSELLDKSQLFSYGSVRKRIESRASKRDLNTRVHRCISHMSLKMEATQVSINR